MSEPMLDHPASAEEVKAQLQCILADPIFKSSRRSCELLEYIVAHTLLFDQDALKERMIGIHVFGRSSDFDTTLDSTVRVSANKLRKRLNQYYAQTGRDRELIIEIPVRSYSARFHVPSPLPDVAHEPLTDNFNHKHRRFWLMAAALLGILAILISMFWIRPKLAVDQFWAPLLSRQTPVLICFGSPSSEPEPAQNPVSPGGGPTTGTVYSTSELRLEVGMSDVQATEQLSIYLWSHHQETLIRPTPGRQLATLRSKPMVLYGMYLNDWRTRLASGLRFHFQMESVLGRRWIEDQRNPGSRAWSIDLSAPSHQVITDYALITRVHDQTTGQWWIGITGLTGAGTLAANQMVFDQKSMAELTARLPRDWAQKNLQIVLETQMVQGSPGGTRTLAVECW